MSKKTFSSIGFINKNGILYGAIKASFEGKEIFIKRELVFYDDVLKKVAKILKGNGILKIKSKK